MLAISAGGGRYRDSAWAVCCLGPLQGGRAVLAVTSRQSASGHRQASRPAGMVRGLMSRIAREPRIVPSLATCRVFDSDGQEGGQAGGRTGGWECRLRVDTQAGWWCSDAADVCASGRQGSFGTAPAGVHTTCGAYQGGAAVEANEGWIDHLRSKQEAHTADGAGAGQSAGTVPQRLATQDKCNARNATPGMQHLPLTNWLSWKRAS